MNKIKFSLLSASMLAAAQTMQSCDAFDDEPSYGMAHPTALVTVRPTDNGFTMQLDDSTTLYPTNMTTSPFGHKEVRALVNYRPEATTNGSKNNVHIAWIDSIRTKQPMATAGADNDKIFGNDPVEIVKDWVTVAEDGYLTLRIRTLWGPNRTTHHINLLTGTNAGNPYELELRHDARGDVGGHTGDALIAFNLNSLPKDANGNVRIRLNWMSFTGRKSAEFSLRMHGATASYTTNLPYSTCVE